MSNSKKVIAVYENLPSGGAMSTYIETHKYIKKYYSIINITEPKYKISNFLHYLYISLIVSQKHQSVMMANTKHDLLLAYHSWLVKTPSILRYTDKPKVYICHELMREYYDAQHIATQSIKERIINFFRLPIKYLDRINIRGKDITVVVNSNFSKKIIDEAYSVNSVVVYPGINTREYQEGKKVTKENQVICIGAINKIKNQYFLVEVLAKVEKNIRPTLMLLGNGFNAEYLELIRNKAKLLGVRVKVKINVSNIDKIKELHKSKVFMYSPISEPFGIVVEEALAAGLPILTCSQGGGYSEVIDSKNGIILDTFDPLIWSKNLVGLLSDNNIISKFRKYNTWYASKYLDSKIMDRKIKRIIDNLL